MKLRNLLFVGISALMLFAVGCSNDDEREVDQRLSGAPGVLQVKLNDIAAVVTRGVAGSDLAANELLVNNYMVYVFNESTGLLEKSVLQDGGNVMTTVEDLSTGTTKKVAVVTNIPEGADTYFTLAEGTAYSSLEALVIEYFDQDFGKIQTEKKGMIMSGEKAGVIISATTANAVEVDVHRVAAKITLADLKINPKIAYTSGDFKVLGISIQRAVSDITVKGEKTETTELLGGISAIDLSVATESPFFEEVNISFTETNTNVLTSSHVYYVLPHNGDGVTIENCTLLTLKAQYGDGEPFYYPIPINAVINDPVDEDNQDASFIKGNHNYNVYVTLKDITNGSTNPEELLERADLDVTIKIVDWTDINQYEEW